MMYRNYCYDFEKRTNQRSAEINDVKHIVSDLLDFYQLKPKFNELHIMDAW
ncbi:MAG: hypothetical protein HC880_08675, partial [Bacteroidia bacterium]|nr:hypothetical protein [Bacteroidia bacterium]